MYPHAASPGRTLACRGEVLLYNLFGGLTAGEITDRTVRFGHLLTSADRAGVVAAATDGPAVFKALFLASCSRSRSRPAVAVPRCRTPSSSPPPATAVLMMAVMDKVGTLRRAALLPAAVSP